MIRQGSLWGVPGIQVVTCVVALMWDTLPDDKSVRLLIVSGMLGNEVRIMAAILSSLHVSSNHCYSPYYEIREHKSLADTMVAGRRHQWATLALSASACCQTDMIDLRLIS